MEDSHHGRKDSIRLLAEKRGVPPEESPIRFPGTHPGTRPGFGATGICLGPEQLGTTLVIERPPVYFAKNGPTPETIELPIVPPRAALATRSLADLVTGLRDSVTAVENNTDGPFLGIAEVLAQDPFGAPSTPEKRPRRRPRVAGVISAVFLRTLNAMRSFWNRHAEASRRWLAGDKTVVLPAGSALVPHHPL
jgi:hypothetical protein